jgi:hypothetical protein
VSIRSSNSANNSGEPAARYRSRWKSSFAAKVLDGIGLGKGALHAPTQGRQLLGAGRVNPRGIALGGLAFEEHAHLQQVVELGQRQARHGDVGVRHIDQRALGSQAVQGRSGPALPVRH